MVRTLALIATALLLLSALPARAEVTDVTPGGFISTHTQVLALPPDEAWMLLTEGLSRWWDASHSYGLVAENLSLKAGPGGCLCETLENGGWVEHLRVIFVQPPASLKLQGALGPLVDMGLHGVMNWTLEPDENGGTLFTSRYVVSGHMDGGFAQLAPVVDAVNGGHFQRLERVSKGLPAAE
ncbi:MAG: SRPBCC family protein [Pseudomonadota bacterium]